MGENMGGGPPGKQEFTREKWRQSLANKNRQDNKKRGVAISEYTQRPLDTEKFEEYLNQQSVEASIILETCYLVLYELFQNLRNFITEQIRKSDPVLNNFISERIRLFGTGDASMSVLEMINMNQYGVVPEQVTKILHEIKSMHYLVTQ